MADNAINPLTNQEVVKQGDNELRRTVQHLPAFYRTDVNQRFLGSTLDPLVQKGSLERVDGFVGRQDAYTRKSTDRYLSATNRDRMAYQLEPAVTYTTQDTTSVNPEDQVKFSGTYDDYINQIKYFGGKVDNHDRLNKEKIYSWNPAIDYDKLINYREYYWMPTGPNAIEIDSVGTGAVAEYKVEAHPLDGSSARAWNFPHRENERNPIVTLYRGNTYKFNVNAKGHPFWIMTEPFMDAVAADGSTSTVYSTGVTNNGTDNGTVTFTVPTGAPDTLYYQCGNHDAMNGILQILTVDSTRKINPENDIIGVKNYSLRTLDLSNGMKVKFTSSKVTTAYQNKEYYVEGVGDAITLTDVEDLITPGSYSTETTILYDTVVYDSRPYAKAFFRPDDQDYITIKRNSRDQNAWSRYNRWFHKSVIEKTADINGHTPVLDETDRAKRPIIEFDSGLELYNHGTVAKKSITVYDTVTTDAFSDVVNTPGYIVDGITLSQGMRIIFAADTDSIVKNKIYTVNFVHASDDSTISTAANDSTAVLQFTEADDGAPADGESVFVEFGTKNQGKTFHYVEAEETWKEAQQKTKVNEQPLFAMYDNDEVAFDNATTYPNSTFEGAKVFEFATSDSATTDTVLGIKVKYDTINNVGDIVFESDHTSGSFTYKSDTTTVTKKLAEGHLHYTTGITTHNNKSAWIERTNESKQRVLRTFIVDDTEKQYFQIDFYKDSVDLTDLEISVSVNGIRKTITTDYTLVDGSTNKYVKFVEELSVDDQVKISGYSSASKVSDKGIYETPDNLSINSKNKQLGTFTWGQILLHVKDIFEKNEDVTGAIPGTSNLRDKQPDAKLNGGTIKQHLGSLLPAVFGLIDQEANVVSAIDYCNLEYEKWYSSFLTYAVGTAYEGVAADRVDEIIAAISQGKNSSFAFYYDDMVGYGENVSTRTYTVQGSSQTEYALDSQHSITTTSSRAVYVYLNDVQLILGTDYTFSTTDDTVNISATLAEGDTIKIKDYSDTAGSYIPATPTKLGIYPSYKPETFTDTTYITDTDVIRRHDGSIIKAYGDERDDLILELEKRIYNNIKVTYDQTLLDVNEVVPSAFTSTEYTLTECDDIMGSDFYVWAGRNNVQYINNTTFSEGSPFTYNYAKSTGRLKDEKMPGHWRGIYKYYYDTDSPHTRPWEILGHSEKPSTWDATYGAAPYTSGNTVLWDAVESQTGRYGKLGIKSYLPVNESGELLDPIAAGLIHELVVPGRRNSWKFGDQGPSETAWRRSSAYPFSVIKFLALTRPAKFFTVFFDPSRLKTNITGNVVSTETDIRTQLSTAKYHLETETNNATGVTTRYTTTGYQPCVVNYLISKGLDTKTFYYDKMKNITTQLAYKLGGFTDKNNLKILTDSISPGSSSGSKFIPDENYKILFRTSNPVNSFYYSGVLIEKNTDTDLDGSTLLGGYKVLGYSTVKPYFNFQYPIKSVSGTKVSVEGAEALQYQNYQQTVQTIPYGYVFDTVQDVVDFLFGYGHWLEGQGFKFNRWSTELKETLNWSNSVREFLFWTTQNWSAGSAVTVSPAADGFELETNNSVVGKLRNLAGDYSILDAGGRKIDINDISTKRVGTTIELVIKPADVGLYNVALNTVQKEHVLIFDNSTVFSDKLYDPDTGFRQQRLKLVGWKTGGWNGDYYAPGFIFDAAQVTYWLKNTDYKIGDTVEYQGKFYVAKINHTSTTEFVTSSWILKDEKPAPQLVPNFDYKISSFQDFYNLETNNFDESQQTLAQRLIGYQSRDYLENLFVNDISQYKFYQGYVREKGTENAITRILKAKYEEQDIALSLYPEWMIRTNRIGNTDAKESIQITLKDNEVVANPQSIELLETTNDTKSYARSLGVAETNLYFKPVDYSSTTTFSRYDYTKAGVDRDQVQVYKTAGYPQLNQVQHTAFNESDLLNIDTTKLKQNELVWVANKGNKDWDVFRITNAGVKIAELEHINSNTELEITFTSAHSFSAGTTTTTADYILIANSESTDLNKVFVVKSVPSYEKVIVDFDGVIASLPVLEDGSTAESYGNVYKFTSVRLSSMDNANDLISFDDYKDKNDSINKEGDKVFADADSDGLWRVYEKQDPYTQIRTLSPDNTTEDQDFGYQIVARNDGRTVVVAAPTDGQGTINFLFRSSTTAGTTFGTQSAMTTTAGDDNTGKLGYSLSMSSDENFVVAGAPYANSYGSDGSTRFSDAGLVKIFVWDPDTFKYGTLSTILPPVDAASQNFGWAHKIVEPGANSVRSTPTKYMFVSAPGFVPSDAPDTDTGRVYMYEWGVGADGSTYDRWTQCLEIDSPDGDINKRFGHRLQVNDNGDILAVSSVSTGTAGKVEIFVRASTSNDDSVQHAFTHVQTLTGATSDGSTLNTKFGDSMTMSKDGTTLVIGAPGYDDSSQADAGAVYYYKWDANADSTLSYTLQQTITAPKTQVNMKFGSTLDINDAGTRLVIGAETYSNHREMVFDSGETTFDLQDTTISDQNPNSGGAFTATKYNTKFVIDDLLVTTSVSADDNFGKGVCAIDNTIFVGAPDDEGNIASDGSSMLSNDGTVTCFDCNVAGEYAWKQLAYETALMDVTKLGNVFEFNKASKQIRDHYNLHDPVKGKILGLADREINIKTTWDPAQYNFGPKANTQTPWGEEHVGEVWWNLSTVKWLWYEQDSQEYKTNNWGNLFPGSSIDIYEWIESTLLPSEYAIASAAASETLGITGTPFMADDSEYTVKQRYNSALDTNVNYYYYWVKNSTSLPVNSTVERKNTTNFVSNLITNPRNSGIKHYAITDTNKLLVYNTIQLVNSDIVLNVDIRTNTFEGDAHSIWKLVREGDKSYRPGTQIETRWWDSLIGKNSTGDTVPDLDLPVNERYGNNIRPRQTWYVDRYAALKEIIDYANSILKKNQLVGTFSLDNLDSNDPEPTAESLEWDASVDTYADLTYINTQDLSGTVKYLVKADENANNYWAIYTWDGSVWSRTKIQTFNTSNYWSYTDWYDISGDSGHIHSENTKIDKQVTYEYELDQLLDLENGKHVKVTSADTGGWKLFMRTVSGDEDWENVGTENGTIKLSTKLYDYSQDATGYAGADNFDDNFFDQEPSQETRHILTALRDDLFINDLALEYNTLFFTGLRKVLEEQTYVDWMFKTSFINVTNSVRQLDQRKTYTTGTDAWIESYINEVKPFHSKLREYKLGYQSTDTQDGMNTDFDSPPFYDATDGKIRNLNVTKDSDKLTEYPWQMWNDYHKKYVSSITLLAGGSGYTEAPTVTILGGTVNSTGPFQIQGTSASGTTSGSYGYYYPLFTSESQANVWDTQNNGGSGASTKYTFDEYAGDFYMPNGTSNTAQTTQSGAYKMYTTPNTDAATATATVRNGEVTKVTLVTKGRNYTATPTVVFTGGTASGTNPTTVAKAYANLNNDLVRDLDVTMKFDRIKSTHDVVDWAASTAYVYGQLIRHNNELYKTTKAYTSTTKFKEGLNNLYKVYGDETGLTASDRLKGFYTPGTGMPGNELNQLMQGVDYGGTMVTGLLFSQGQGWDKSGWYDFPWDNYGASNVVSFTADGSTSTYTFDTAPATGKVYQVYVSADDSTRLKLDDIINGDGSTTAFTLTTTPDEGALVEFIPFDDDGVLTPTDDRTIDSIIKGGMFGSALGVSESDILLEGDEFVSPDTSYAPEEAIPGQIFDTLDIKVYTSPESGVPFITEKNHRVDGSTQTFSIGDYPGTIASVTVSIDGKMKKITTDYTVDITNKTITFNTAPALFSIVSTKVFAISGENYRVLDQYTGDGSTVTFTTGTSDDFQLDSTASEIYITIDGVPTTSFSTASIQQRLQVTFDSAPAADSYIQIAGFNKSATSTRSYASIRNQAVTYDGSTNRYTLTYPPGAIGPFSGLTIIEVNGKVLRGPDNTYYTGDGSTYTYGVTSGMNDDSTVDPAKTVTAASQVEVYVNGTKKDLNTHYTVDVTNQNVEFKTDSVPTATDVICISTLVDNQYYNEGTDIILDKAQIDADSSTLGYALEQSDVMSVTTFNNAFGSKIRREVLEGRTENVFKLRFDALSGAYTYVWLNGDQLLEGTDFTISGNTITVIGKTIVQADRLDVMYFAIDSAVNATGFRIFKDMLNRTFYKRISKTATTTIKNTLVAGTSEIEVVDATVLSTPNAANNMPGVIFIDKERIEYFTLSGNTLGQLRRGTLGTGIKEHSGGTEVVDASGTQTIPYADTVYTNTFTSDGSTAVYALSQAPSSASELDIFIGGQRLLLTSEDGSTINYSINNDQIISTATFVDSFDVSSQDGDVRDVKFNADGTKMFMLGRADTSDVYEYTLTTAFDVSTASFVDGIDVGVGTLGASGSQGDNSANSIEFNTDGTKLFVLGQGNDLVNEYALSTGFDVSTASFTQSFDISAQESLPYGLAFNNDGTKMFICGWAGDDINEYVLTTGFDISTASYSQNYSVAAQNAKPSAVQFNTDGTKMYVLRGTGAPEIQEYRLTTGFDVSTASFVNSDAVFDVSSEETKPRGFCFNSDGTKLFVCGYTGDDINEYTLTSTVTLTTPPASGTQVKVLHKKGQVWYTAKDGNPSNGLGLQASTTAQAKFIAGEPTNAPE